MVLTDVQSNNKVNFFSSKEVPVKQQTYIKQKLRPIRLKQVHLENLNRFVRARLVCVLWRLNFDQAWSAEISFYVCVLFSEDFQKIKKQIT